MKTLVILQDVAQKFDDAITSNFSASHTMYTALLQSAHLLILAGQLSVDSSQKKEFLEQAERNYGFASVYIDSVKILEELVGDIEA